MKSTESTGHAFPVEAILPKVADALDTSHLVIEAPPGAGKSTILPPWLMHHIGADGGTIILIQPRRVAAVSVARFIAEQLGEPVGLRVGFHIRQQRVASSSTQLLVVTEGVFTRMVQCDPELTGISYVLFDEFHERNLHSDLGLALALEVLELRPSLRLIIMSATLPGAEIQQWLSSEGIDCQLLISEGRSYPIEYQYRPVTSLSDWITALPAVIDEGLDLATHGVLVFLPGAREMRFIARRLNLPADVQCFELHGQLSIEAQREVLRPLSSGRKLVLATNLAETSLTIPDIDVVVDSGRERQSIYDPRYGLTRLSTRMISRASAGQRAGRAGRVGPGICIRLWSAEQTERLDAFGQPAVVRENLAELVLELYVWGAQAPQLKWFSPPSLRLLDDAERRLVNHGALQQNEGGKLVLTSLGRQLAGLGTELRFAQTIVAAKSLADEPRQLLAWTIAALETRELKLEGDVSEFLLQAHAQGRQYPRTQQRYQHWQRELGISSTRLLNASTWLEAMPALLQGFAERVVKVAAGRLQMANGLALKSSQALPPESWLLALDVSVPDDLTQASLWSYLPISFADLLTQQHPLKVSRERAFWRSEKGGLAVSVQQCWGQLVMTETELNQAITAEQRTEALLDWIRQRGIRQATAWSQTTDNLVERLQRYRQWLQTKALHESNDSGQTQPVIKVSKEELQADSMAWAESYLHSIKTRDALLKWSPNDALLAQLDYQAQQQFNSLFPTQWQAPSGRKHRIHYAPGEPPRVALKLQEVFGTPQSPRIAGGQEVIVFELLSPAGRPLQRTADLASFWQNAWPMVRKEMRGRYPKHPWPENPLQAQASHLSTRQIQFKHAAKGGEGS